MRDEDLREVYTAQLLLSVNTRKESLESIGQEFFPTKKLR